MRAKFRCNAVTFYGDPTKPDASRVYQLNAVTDDSTPENERYHKYTPFGELKLTVENPAAHLEVGKEYYLDFTPCNADAKPETTSNTDAMATDYYQPAHADTASGR